MSIYQTKICYKCQTDKPISEFNSNKREKDGIAGICKFCRKLQYIQKHGIHVNKTDQEILERKRNWAKNNPQKSMWFAARHRAKNRGMEFSILPEDIQIPEFCPVLGIKLQQNKGSGKNQPSSPSLDRIDNSKGYIKGNIVVMSLRANNLKGSASVEELELILEFVKSKIHHPTSP